VRIGRGAEPALQVKCPIYYAHVTINEKFCDLRPRNFIVKSGPHKKREAVLPTWETERYRTPADANKQWSTCSSESPNLKLEALLKLERFLQKVWPHFKLKRGHTFWRNRVPALNHRQPDCNLGLLFLAYDPQTQIHLLSADTSSSVSMKSSFLGVRVVSLLGLLRGRSGPS
jgi:hypothetical protein